MGETFGTRRGKAPATSVARGQPRGSSEHSSSRRQGLRKGSCGMLAPLPSSGKRWPRARTGTATRALGAPVALARSGGMGGALGTLAARLSSARLTPSHDTAIRTSPHRNTRHRNTRHRNSPSHDSPSHDSHDYNPRDSLITLITSAHNSLITTVERPGAAGCPCGFDKFAGGSRKMLSPRGADSFTLVTFALECVERRYP